MEKKPTFLFVVAAALIDQNQKVLLQKRPEGKQMAGLWEFPGGKVEEGETPELALVRELYEELGISVDANDLGPAIFASEPLDDRHLILLLYTCKKWIGKPISIDAEEIRWVSIDKMNNLPMPPADLPMIEKLAHLL